MFFQDAAGACAKRYLRVRSFKALSFLLFEALGVGAGVLKHCQFFFLKPSESITPLFPPPGHAGLEVDGPR